MGLMGGICILYKRSGKTNVHLFIEYIYAKELWKEVEKIFANANV